MSRHATRWFYKLPGEPYAYGPSQLEYTNAKAVRAMIRKCWGYKKLPAGTQVWRTP